MGYSSFFASICLFAQAAADGGGMQTLVQLGPFIVIGLLFWVLLIRPESKKNAELGKMREGLKKNDRVLTAGGIFGTVVNVQKDAKDVTIRVDEGNNTRIRVLKSAIAQILVGEESEASKVTDS